MSYTNKKLPKEEIVYEQILSKCPHWLEIYKSMGGLGVLDKNAVAAFRSFLNKYALFSSETLNTFVYASLPQTRLLLVCGYKKNNYF